MKLTKRQINRYIRYNFDEPEYIEMLIEQRDNPNIEWFIEAKEKTDYFPFVLYNSIGYEDETTFKGYANTITIKTKDEARELAIHFQIWASERNLSYAELIDNTSFFEHLGRRFGLLREFKENGVI